MYFSVNDLPRISVSSGFLLFPFKIRAQHWALLRVAYQARNPVLKSGVVESSLQHIIMITRDDSHIAALVLFCKGCTLLFWKDMQCKTQ